MHRAAVVVILVSTFASGANAQEAVQLSGFALLRASNEIESGPLAQEPFSSQLQLGIDWRQSATFGAHVHVLARNDEGTRRGSLGIPEAYLELNLHPGRIGRVRVRGGAMFLPTSRENVDALWENPYAITSSALNAWFGEELRPIGVDASWLGKRFFGGATLFRGNDTFGALPAVRGWRMHDHWTLLGEHVPVDAEYFTSVSAENDDRTGWSARGGWSGDRVLVQLTHIDNRSDGRDYGELFNWGTRFDVAAAEFTSGDWTLAGEYGWGPTFLVVGGVPYTNDIRAGYLLASRRWSRARATIRVDEFAVDDNGHHAVTLAGFWTARAQLRLGAELSTSGGERRALLEARYYFSAR